jgi:3-hydroxypropanoate dehydrogenase
LCHSFAPTSVKRTSLSTITAFTIMSTDSKALVSRNLADDARKLLFTAARTNQYFVKEEVPESKLRELYELWKWGPTAANGSPLRVVFLRTPEGKAKLIPALMDSNKEKSEQAPVVAVLAYDAAFYTHFPRLMPPMAYLKDYLATQPEMAKTMAQQSATLSAGYFILAARSVGLDAGPMGGFDAATLDKALFEPHEGTARGNWKSILVINLGYGDSTKVYPRAPRFDFEEVNIIE